MSYNDFRSIFYEILYRCPLPCEDQWTVSRLSPADLRNNKGWTEVLYRNTSDYQCNHRHTWRSSWSMILFLFRRDVKRQKGSIRIKRFGQRCENCKEDDSYHIGFCHRETQAIHIVECVLMNILQRCYQGRSDSEIDDLYIIVPAGNVSRRKFGGNPHNRSGCEACANNRCQEVFQQLIKRS